MHHVHMQGWDLSFQRASMGREIIVTGWCFQQTRCWPSPAPCKQWCVGVFVWGQWWAGGWGGGGGLEHCNVNPWLYHASIHPCKGACSIRRFPMHSHGSVQQMQGGGAWGTWASFGLLLN
jgi:hypothetical protein